MGSARARSTTGLRLLDAQTRVVLTGTAHHQDELAWYTPLPGGAPTQVEVELSPAPIWSAEQSGWWGIEARVDGRRVGELIHPAAGWYGPRLRDLLHRGHRVGAEAHVVRGEAGLTEVELYLPVPETLAGASAEPVEPPAGRPPGPRPAPMWMGLAAAVLLLAMVVSVAMDRVNRAEPTIANPAPDTRLTLAAEQPPLPATPTPDPPTPSPAAAAVPTGPPATRVAVVAPKPRPKATARRVSKATAPKPKPTPKPAHVARVTVTKKPKPTPKPEPTAEDPEPRDDPEPDPPTRTKPAPPSDDDPKPDPKPQPDPPSDDPSDDD